VYWIDAGEVPGLSTSSLDATIEVSYEIHTNRELEFMLNRGKPLAVFYDAYPPLPCEEIVPRKAFAPYVSSGKFDLRIYVEPLTEPPPSRAPWVKGIIYFLYAKRSESWRIDAYIAMLNAAARSGWNDGFERLQGSLLGYLDWQNEAHIAGMLKEPQASQWPWVRELRERLERRRGLNPLL